MFFANRGNVLCVAGSKLEYARQIICALATDNVAVLPKDEHSKTFARSLPSDVLVEANALEYKDLRAALIAHDYNKDTADLRKSLANRQGCLVINVQQQPDNSYNLHLLTIERTVSNNITSTGGNVQLMSIDDKVI